MFADWKARRPWGLPDRRADAPTREHPARRRHWDDCRAIERYGGMIVLVLLFFVLLLKRWTNDVKKGNDAAFAALSAVSSAPVGTLGSPASLGRFASRAPQGPSKCDGWTTSIHVSRHLTSSVRSDCWLSNPLLPALAVLGLTSCSYSHMITGR